jgi:hypothetical protein
MLENSYILGYTPFHPLPHPQYSSLHLFTQSSLSTPQISNHPVKLSTHHTTFQYKLAFSQSNSPYSVLGTALPIISALSHFTRGILFTILLEKDCCGRRAISAGKSCMRFAPGILSQRSVSAVCCCCWEELVDCEGGKPVIVPEVAVPVVEERVVLSRVWEEMLEPGGEREDWLREEREGVVNERGRVDDGRRACGPAAKPDAAPRD